MGCWQEKRTPCGSEIGDPPNWPQTHGIARQDPEPGRAVSTAGVIQCMVNRPEVSPRRTFTDGRWGLAKQIYFFYMRGHSAVLLVQHERGRQVEFEASFSNGSRFGISEELTGDCLDAASLRTVSFGRKSPAMFGNSCSTFEPGAGKTAWRIIPWFQSWFLRTTRR